MRVGRSGCRSRRLLVCSFVVAETDASVRGVGPVARRKHGVLARSEFPTRIEKLPRMDFPFFAMFLMSNTDEFHLADHNRKTFYNLTSRWPACGRLSGCSGGGRTAAGLRSSRRAGASPRSRSGAGPSSTRRCDRGSPTSWRVHETAARCLDHEDLNGVLHGSSPYFAQLVL